MFEYEKLEALFLKLHELMKIEMIRTLYVLCKTRELRFSRSVSKDDGGKVARWLHSHVQ